MQEETQRTKNKYLKDERNGRLTSACVAILLGEEKYMVRQWNFNITDFDLSVNTGTPSLALAIDFLCLILIKFNKILTVSSCIS